MSMRKKDITEEERKLWANEINRKLFDCVIEPAMNYAVTILEKSNCENGELLFVAIDRMIPLELRKEALDILISRLAEKEIMIIANNYQTPFELQKRIVEGLLASLNKESKQHNRQWT